MINNNLQQQAQTLFIEWLGICTSQVKIDYLAENVLDYSPNTNPYVVLVNSSDVHEGQFCHHTLSQNTDLKGHFKKRFKNGDILYSEIRPRNHHYAFCQFEPDCYIASTRLMVIRKKASVISNALLYQYLLLPSVLEEFTLKTESRSGTFPQGRYEDMASIIVPYGGLNEQAMVAPILDAIHKQIWANEQENNQLCKLRDTLLPRLMNGEIDVSKIDV